MPLALGASAVPRIALVFWLLVILAGISRFSPSDVQKQ